MEQDGATKAVECNFSFPLQARFNHNTESNFTHKDCVSLHQIFGLMIVKRYPLPHIFINSLTI